MTATRGAGRGRRPITLEIGGRSRTVQLSDTGTQLVVTLDGTAHALDALQVEPGRWSLLLGSARASRDVRVRRDHDGAWTVFVEGRRVPVAIREPCRRRAPGDESPASGPARITAPMPGKVVRLLVSLGDRVEPGHGVAIVEAMKMENELKAPRAGTVLQVFVREGASVEASAPLMVIG